MGYLKYFCFWSRDVMENTARRDSCSSTHVCFRSTHGTVRKNRALQRGREILLVLILPALLALPGLGAEPGLAKPPRPGMAPTFHPNRLLIKPKANAKLAGDQLAQLHAANGARVLRTFAGIGGLQVVEVPGTPDIKALVETYRSSGAADYAEPDYEVHALATPNDPLYSSGVLWGLNNTGQNGGTYDADIDGPEGWDLRHDATNIIVAVIDTGIRLTHQDLAANLWRNTAEITGNGLDDDHDGYVDDVNGINAISHTGNPNDDNGHGTHVAGIIGGLGNNGVGVAGVAWRVQLMGCKFLSSSGGGWDSDAITCIDYARTHGASVLNNSWGGGSYSQGLKDAIDAAGTAGIIFVAAAGNSSSDIDRYAFYPASYDCPNIVVVAATTRNDDLAYFSSYGQATVALGAPGMDITSTWYASDSAYQSLSGTSMATPQVSGVLALMKAQFPAESYLELLNRVYGSVDPLPALAGKCRTGGRINLARALGSATSQPGNDDFANRLVVSSTISRARGANLDATKESGEPNHAGNAGGKSVWWSWRPPATGIATLTTAGSSFNTLLAVYTGTSVSSLSLVASNDDSPGGDNTSSVTFEANSATDYAIAVDGYDGAAGTVALNFTLQPRPVNDNFTSRIAIAGTVATVNGSNTLATAESGEPLHAGVGGGNSVWWSWTPGISGPATITTAGSDFNTVLAVYTGTELTNLTLVAANDDDAVGGTNTSRVVFNTVAGTTYQIAVDGYAGATGNVALNTPPSNDLFANRAVVSGLNASAVGFNVLATKEPLEPNHAGNTGGKSLWWTSTAPASGAASVTTIGSSFNTVLAVYTGTALGSLSLVAANDNDPYGDFTSLVSFTATAGTTYQIAVDGVNGASGMVRLQAIMGSQYVITDVGSAPGYNNCSARSINNFGTVAGSYMTDAPEYTRHACIWSSSGGLQTLMTGDTESEANDVNDFGQAVGYLRRPGYGSIPFIWQNGVMTELGGFTSHPFGGAYAIDNSGRVVGWSSNGSYIHAFLCYEGVMKDLGALTGAGVSAYGLNGPNYVIGAGNDSSSSPQKAMLWRNGTYQTLPIPIYATDGCALSVNALSQVVGHAQGGSYLHAIRWDNEQYVDLGPGPDGYSEANSINNLGQVVGDDQHYALLYQNGQWRFLKDLVPAGSGWTSLFMALKINDHGQIAGAGLRNGYSRGFVMTPLTPVTPQAIILSPTNGQTFFEYTDIPITLWLVPDTSNLARLDLFRGSTCIGTLTNAPFDQTCCNLPAGQYVLSARTTSSSGATATSRTVSISVLPRPPLTLWVTPKTLTLSWPVSSLSYVVESATNLRPPVVWQTSSNPVYTVGTSNRATLERTINRQFFRLRSGP